MRFEPDILRFADGRQVTTPEDWTTRRREMLDILAREEYGFMPPKKPASLRMIDKNNGHFAGHGIEEKLELTLRADRGEFKLPFSLLYPDTVEKHPLFLYISFENALYQRYFPAENVLARGYAVALLHYTAIASDDNDFANGLAPLMDRPADGTGWGKISLWAWTLSRALDVLIERDDIDRDNIAVIGHSRLGKTALWCGANDERIRFSCVNDSGCSGAAMERGKNPESETAEIIYRRFPFWFCENYGKYGKDIEKMPFDQHMAIAACCPRFVLVSSASLDAWADPPSEKRSCEAAKPAWERFGGDEGGVAYFLRDGTHFLSLYDWNNYMDFIDAHRA